MSLKRVDVSSYRKVFVVGDIHGCLTELNERLAFVGFDEVTDLLVSVGDLVDRGVNSLECLELITKPWFLAVKGNHEDMAIKAVMLGTREYVEHWVLNGGSWYSKLSLADQERARELLVLADQLPLLLELSRNGKKALVCHADYPYSEYVGLEGRGIEEYVIWSRERVKDLKSGIKYPISGVDVVFFGHTPMKKIIRVANQVFLDTGAVYGHSLAVVDMDTEIRIAGPLHAKD